MNIEKMKLGEIRKSNFYKNLPRNMQKYKLNKKELVKLYKESQKKSKTKKSDIPITIKKKSIPEVKSNHKKILKDLKKKKLDDRELNKLIKQFNLPSQEEYLRDIIKIQMELNEKK